MSESSESTPTRNGPRWMNFWKKTKSGSGNRFRFRSEPPFSTSARDTDRMCHSVEEVIPTDEFLQMLCSSIKRRIVYRAFYSWLEYVRILKQIRNHLPELIESSKLGNLIEIKNSAQFDDGLTLEFFESCHDPVTGVIPQDKVDIILKLLYFGGCSSQSLRQKVWPYLLNHYTFGMTSDERKKQDEETHHHYETTMTEWLAIEAIVKQRDKEIMIANLTKYSSGSTSTSSELPPPAVTRSENVQHDHGTSSPPDLNIVKEAQKSSLTNDVFTDDDTDISDSTQDTVRSNQQQQKSCLVTTSSSSSLKNVLSNNNNNNNSDSKRVRFKRQHQIESQMSGSITQVSTSSLANHVTKKSPSATSYQQECAKDTAQTELHQLNDATGDNENKSESSPGADDVLGIRGGVDEATTYKSQRPTILCKDNTLDQQDSIESIDNQLIDDEGDDEGDEDEESEDDEVLKEDLKFINRKKNVLRSRMKSPCLSPASSNGGIYTTELLDSFSLNLHRIEKDVQRCDRKYWFFTDKDNLEKLRNVMCTYVWENLDQGYVQGMCDLVAPLLVIFDDEVLAYSCFIEVMKRMISNFPNGGDMDVHFSNLRSLIQILDSELFELMHSNGDCTYFYFCYRWFLLDFKRVFIALALVQYYRTVIIENTMDFADIIKFFNDMAEKHDAKEILKMARGLVEQSRNLVQILTDTSDPTKGSSSTSSSLSSSLSQQCE